MKIAISRRRFVMAGVAFLAALHLPGSAGNKKRVGKTYNLGDDYYAVNGWVVKREDLA